MWGGPKAALFRKQHAHAPGDGVELKRALTDTEGDEEGTPSGGNAHIQRGNARFKRGKEEHKGLLGAAGLVE